MQHVFYSIELALLLCAAVAVPVLAFLAYRTRRGSRRALVGNCLVAAGYELALTIPMAHTLEALHWIPTDAALRDVASSVGSGVLPVGLLFVIVGLALSPATKKEVSR